MQRPEAVTGSTEPRPQPSIATAPPARFPRVRPDSKDARTAQPPLAGRLERPTSPPAGRSSDVGIRTTPMPSAAVAPSAPPAATTVDSLPAPSPPNPETLPAPVLPTPVPTAGTLSKESIALDEILKGTSRRATGSTQMPRLRSGRRSTHERFHGPLRASDSRTSSWATAASPFQKVRRPRSVQGSWVMRNVSGTPPRSPSVTCGRFSLHAWANCGESCESAPSSRSRGPA